MTQPGHIPRLKLEDPKAWAALLDPGEELLWQARVTGPLRLGGQRKLGHPP